MRRSIGAVLLAGGIGTVCLLAYATDLSRPSGWIWGAAISLWSLAPYGVAARATQLARGVPAAERAMLAGATLLSCVGLAALASAFVFQPDPQGGLVPVFLPVWQLLGIAPFAIGAQWLARRALPRQVDRALDG